MVKAKWGDNKKSKNAVICPLLDVDCHSRDKVRKEKKRK